LSKLSRFRSWHKRERRARLPLPESFFASFPPVSISLLLLFALFASACSRLEKRSPAKIDSERFNQEVRLAVEAVSVSGIWIKSPPERTSAAQGVSRAADVVVNSELLDRALGAAKDAAAREGLSTRVETQRRKNGLLNVELRFATGNQVVGRWKFHEVRKILRAAIIIDDLGNDAAAAKKLLALPYPLTFSVLPGLAHSARTAAEVYSSGREVMLHLPMEPRPGAAALPGPGEIKVGMTDPEVARIIARDLATVPHARGVNNHMGSLATADPVLMAEVMRVLAQRQLFFVDSRTTAQSAALNVARRMGVPAFYRSVFLDDAESVDYSLGQLRQFRYAIEERGMAIAIGHPHPTTIQALKEFLPELERDDIELVPASDLLRLPGVASLSPPAEHP
jgi:uncharacterized protein